MVGTSYAQRASKLPYFGVDPGKIYFLGRSSYNRDSEPKNAVCISTPKPSFSHPEAQNRPKKNMPGPHNQQAVDGPRRPGMHAGLCDLGLNAV